VRYGKDLLALKSFASDEQGKVLCATAGPRAPTPSERVRRPVHHLFGKIAFPKIRKNFENSTRALRRASEDTARDRLDILINHPMKKQS